MRLKYLLFGLFTVANIINVSARIDGEGLGSGGGVLMITRSHAFSIDDTIVLDEENLLDNVGEELDRFSFDELDYQMLLKSVPVQSKNRIGYGNSRKPFIQEIKILVK